MNDKERFDKFTEQARKVLSLAQEEAQRFNHNYIGTEHLLLESVREEERRARPPGFDASAGMFAAARRQLRIRTLPTWSLGGAYLTLMTGAWSWR